MSKIMKIEKQSSKLIKPFVQTPPFSHYKLGFTDEFAPLFGLSVVLFFSTNINHNPNFFARLENSLAKTLTRFYPLAGKYAEETHSVDCNDQGVEFSYTKVDVKLQDILVSEMNVKFIDQFTPSKINTARQPSDPSLELLAIEVTTFECGGIAIGVNGTHKMVDASTLCTLVNAWAVTNHEENDIEFAGPGFNSSILFPARGLSMIPVPPMNDVMLKKYTRKKLSFSGSVLSKMKAKGNNSQKRWSKVQLVSAIMWKTFMAVDLAKHHHPRESILIQAINLRERMGPFIPKDSCGNLWGLCVTECKIPETTEELTDRLSDSVKKVVSNFSKGHHDHNEGREMVLNSFLSMNNISESTNVVITTSWCKFPFYEADFGFGKPIWAAPGTIPINQSIHMMDDVEGNGVETYVFLDVKDVPYFETALEHVKAFEA